MPIIEQKNAQRSPDSHFILSLFTVFVKKAALTLGFSTHARPDTLLECARYS
jgi:hypothetical protein